MKEANGKLRLDARWDHAAECAPQAELEIEDVMKILAKQPNLIEDAASPERRCLRDVPGLTNHRRPGHRRRLRHIQRLKRAVRVLVSTSPRTPADLRACHGASRRFEC